MRCPLPAFWRRLRANDAYKSIGCLDNSDDPVLVIDQSQYTLQLLQPDESLLFRTYSAKSLLLCDCTRPAVFNYDHAQFSGLPNTVALRVQSAAVSSPPRSDARSGEGTHRGKGVLERFRPQAR